MSDYSELKRVAEELIAANDLFFNESPQCNEVGDAWSLADDRFTEAASPEVILALIAENERLKNRLEVDPRHDYDGISTRDATVKVLDEQVDQLKADNERLRADYAGLARFNPEWDRVAAAQDSVREHMAMVVQLKAEVAGLRTGYEAYERVNAELKAEVEQLKGQIRLSKTAMEMAIHDANGRHVTDSMRDRMEIERQDKEIQVLRKDSESYRLLSFCHGQGTLELVRSHHELCAEIRRLKILAGEPVPQTPEEFVGPSPEGPTARIRRKLAALGKGEQS
ncbi:MAG: hypothetical protein KID05_09975 [Pseudomonas sp.]|uniref:hypothetical protein n=1 Tax=Pseudomonas sp. TaxID=306 RepID=UPI00235728DF|nr:hypothetical protein [Pseudomonas sp.]MBS5839482.1 hypothetical protein [Pseudomonas sp.]